MLNIFEKLNKGKRTVREGINTDNMEYCKDCPYYYGEINWCMYGEEDVPDNMEQKCKENSNEE